FASASPGKVSVAGSKVSFRPVRKAMLARWHSDVDMCPSRISQLRFSRFRERTQSMKFWKWVTSGPSRSGMGGPGLYAILGKLTLFARFDTPAAVSGVVCGVNSPRTVVHLLAEVT